MRKVPAKEVPASIAGIGIDIINAGKINAALKRLGTRFIKRILTARETLQLKHKGNKAQFVASRFAAKEAFYKSVSSIARPSWQDVSVTNDADGRPHLHIESAALTRRLKGYKLHISISHDNLSTVVVCILERRA